MTNKNAGERLHNICTLFTQYYLIQGLALYYSLKRHTSRFHLWVLCVDDTIFHLLKKMKLHNVTLIRLETIMDEKLAMIRQERRTHEFCWTIKSSYVTYLLNTYDLPSILYMDADLFFFKDVRHIYKEWGDNSIFLTKLWLGPKWEKKAGRYSSGLIGFKRDKTGINCLRLWQLKCLKWCYDTHINGLWGDQKYLDDWPRFFPRIKISDNKGINAGPWNIKRGHMVEGDTTYFANRKLICYHFSGFEMINEAEFELCNRKKLPAKAVNIYSAYLDEIQKVIARIKSEDDRFMQSIIRKAPSRFYNYYGSSQIRV